MTNEEKLERDIGTLRESLALSGLDFRNATNEQKAGLLQHVRWCMTELSELEQRLREGLNPPS